MFKLPKLPFEIDSLNPLFTKEQLEIHYTKHHQAYCDNFNDALRGYEVEGKTVSEIISNISRYDQSVINQGGGFYNHTFFWKSLTFRKQDIPQELILNIDKSFGSLEVFKNELFKKAKTKFGSGWIWLIYNSSSDRLEIIETDNQDSPIMDFVREKIGDNYPLLNIDVWEHAYYIDYKNRRQEYIDNIWDFINWEEVTDRLIKK